MRFLIIDGENPQLRVHFFNKFKIGFLNPKESKVDSSVPLMHHDPRDLGLTRLVKKRKIRFRILSDLRIQSWIFLRKCSLTIHFFELLINRRL